MDFCSALHIKLTKMRHYSTKCPHPQYNYEVFYPYMIGLRFVLWSFFQRMPNYTQRFNPSNHFFFMSEAALGTYFFFSHRVTESLHHSVTQGCNQFLVMAVHLPHCLFVCLIVNIFFFLCHCLLVYLSANAIVWLSICLRVSMSDRLSLSLSDYHMSVSFCPFFVNCIGLLYD